MAFRRGKTLSRGATVALLATGAAVVAALAAPYTFWGRDLRFRRLPLVSLEGEPTRRRNDPVFLYWLGKRLNQAGRFAEAAPILERGVALDSDSVRLRDAWTQALLGSGQVSVAFGQLKQFAGTHTDSASAHLLLGRFYVTQNAYKSGNDVLEKAVGLDPALSEAWALLAHCRLSLGGLGGAEEALRRAVKLDPHDGVSHLQLAALVAPRHPEEARGLFDKAVALAPKNAVCHRERAGFLLGCNELELAEQAARTALHLVPDDPKTHLILGRALERRGMRPQARRALESAAKLDPFDPVAPQELRRLCRLVGDASAATRWEKVYLERSVEAQKKRRIDDAMAVHPENRQLHRELAALLARRGDINGTIRQLSQAIGGELDSPRVLVASARELRLAGRAKAALPLLRQALLRAEASPDAIEELGMTQVALGRLHEAAIHFERIRDWKAERRQEHIRLLQQRAAALAKDPAPAEVFYRRCLEATSEADFQAALQKGLAVDAEHTRLWRMALNERFRRGDTTGAREVAQRLIALSPEDGGAHACLAILLLLSGSSDAQTLSAAQAHLEAASIDPTAEPTKVYGLGLLALIQGKGVEAARLFRRSAELDPGSFGVWKRIAEAERLAGNPHGAAAAEAEFERRNKESRKS